MRWTLRRLLPLVLLPGLAACAPGVQAGATTSPLPAATGLTRVFLDGEDTASACQSLSFNLDGSVVVALPPRFPSPAARKTFFRNYVLDCGEFAVQNIQGRLVFQRLPPEALASVLAVPSSGVPYLLRVGDYTMLDFSTPGTLTIRTLSQAAVPRGTTVALQQGEAPLQVVAFDGAWQPVTYDPSRPYTVFAQAPYGSVRAFQIDPVGQTITILLQGVRFPARR